MVMIPQPIVTGDIADDQWKHEVTNMLNTGGFQQVADTQPVVSSGGGAQGPRGTPGADGEDGSQAVDLVLFKTFTDEQTSLSSLAVPADGTYTFSDGEFTSTNLEGWTRTPTSGNYIYRIRRYITADASATSEAILNNEWSTPELFIRSTVSYDVEVDGFDFIRADTGDLTLSAVARRSQGESVEIITDQIQDDNVFWTRVTINSQIDETVPVWNNTSTYSQGTIVQLNITIGSGQPVTLTWRARRDVVAGVIPTTTTSDDWELTTPGRLTFNDTLWSFPTTSGTEVNRRRRGLTITVSSSDVTRQTRFIPHLNNDLSAVP